MPFGDQYSLCWEKDVLVRFGKKMRTFTKEMVLSYARGEIIQRTIFAALFAAVALPKFVINLCNMIDSEWAMVMSRADSCGVLLAKALLARQQGLRPVSLIGYGMGGRLIFACLKHLAAQGDAGLGIIENAVMLGAAMPVVVTEWNAVKAVVAGRWINGYSANDWMLAVMFRYQNFSIGAPAGLAPVKVCGVENADLSALITGHLDYPNKMGLIVETLRLEV